MGLLPRPGGDSGLRLTKWDSDLYSLIKEIRMQRKKIPLLFATKRTFICLCRRLKFLAETARKSKIVSAMMTYLKKEKKKGNKSTS